MAGHTPVLFIPAGTFSYHGGQQSKGPRELVTWFLWFEVERPVTRPRPASLMNREINRGLLPLSSVQRSESGRAHRWGSARRCGSDLTARPGWPACLQNAGAFIPGLMSNSFPASSRGTFDINKQPWVIRAASANFIHYAKWHISKAHFIVLKWKKNILGNPLYKIITLILRVTHPCYLENAGFRGTKVYS